MKCNETGGWVWKDKKLPPETEVKFNRWPRNLFINNPYIEDEFDKVEEQINKRNEKNKVRKRGTGKYDKKLTDLDPALREKREQLLIGDFKQELGDEIWKVSENRAMTLHLF